MPRRVPDGEPATAPPTGARALLATDLDGTLLGADAQLSPRTRRALAAAAGGPVEVVVVTGRPPMFLTSLLDGADIDGEALCANGSMVVDLATIDVLQVRAMPADTVRAILDFAADTDPPSQVRAMLWRPGHEGLRLVGSGRRFSDEVLAALAEGWLAYKVLVGSSDAAADPSDFLVAMDAVLGAIATVTHSMPGHPVVEIGPLGVDKGTALAELAAARGVERSSVHAVGDMPNDLPMLRWAGRSYAVANAHPHVLAEVDFHLGANTDDAVAVLLESLHRLMAEPEV